MEPHRRGEERSAAAAMPNISAIFVEVEVGVGNRGTDVTLIVTSVWHRSGLPFWGCQVGWVTLSPPNLMYVP